jgi:toxin ParE1/3/4
MKYRIIFSRGAKADIRSAVRWYEREDPSLAFRFLLEMRALKRRIANNPYVFPIKGAVRRALLKRFPYYVYFSLNYELVFVIAVVHQRRADILVTNGGNGHS